MLSNRSVEGVLFPIVVGFIPHTVKPKPTDFAVVFTQNLNAVAKVLQVFFEVRFIAFLVPVQKRVVEEGNDAFRIARIHEFTHEVAPDKMRSV